MVKKSLRYPITSSGIHSIAKSTKHYTSFCLNIGCNDSLSAWEEAPILDDCAWARASLKEYGWLGELSWELTLCHK